MSPRIGVFGGTFDPMHLAHRDMARALRDELALDKVHIVPAGQPYHRAQAPQASAEQRLAMARLTLGDEGGLWVDAREVRRPRPAYTVETLTELRAEYGEAAELWLLIGGDSLAALPGWRHWQQIFTLANLAVWQRPDLPTPPLPPELAARWQARQVADFSKRTQYGTIRALTLPAQAVSATAIRQALAAGQPCAGLLAPAVVDYINQQHLYGR